MIKHEFGVSTHRRVRRWRPPSETQAPPFSFPLVDRSSRIRFFVQLVVLPFRLVRGSLISPIMSSNEAKDLEMGKIDEDKPMENTRSSVGSLSSNGRSNSLDVSSHLSDKVTASTSASRANSMSMSSRNLGGLRDTGSKTAIQLQSSRNLVGGVQEHTSGGAVTEFRATSAVGTLGVIETGLESTNHTKRSTIPGRRTTNRRSNGAASDDDLSSLGGETMTGRSALTGLTSRPGRCIVRKCTVMVGRRGRQTEKVLLHPMKVDLPNGSLTAIIGPSGSGKTTLMKFLSGSLDNSVRFRGGGK